MGFSYPKGSEWRRWDLQVQTIIDDGYVELSKYSDELKVSHQSQWKAFTTSMGGEEYALKYDSKDYFYTSKDDDKTKAVNYARNFIKFLEAFHGDEVCLAITDHNYDHPYLLGALLKASNGSRVSIIAGVEVNVGGIHMLLLFGDILFGKDNFSEGIKCFLSKINVDTKKVNNVLTISDRSYKDVLKLTSDNKGIVIYPHCNSDNGIFQERTKTDRTQLADHFNHLKFNILQGKNRKGGENIERLIKSRGKEIASSYCYTIAPDSRCLKEILSPDDEGNYTWIKADPTFEGLRQMAYDSDSRLKIQEYNPQTKNTYQTISRIRFLDDSPEKRFGSEWIPLNPDLNAIIGGKSSGKSLLLYHMAKTANPEEVESKVKLSNSSTYEGLTNVDVELEWSNGEISTLFDFTDNKPITYIPQLYINHLAEDAGKDHLNELIRTILTQQESYKNFMDDQEKLIHDLNKSINDIIDKLFALRKRYADLNNELKPFGSHQAVQNEIKRLSEEVKKLRDKSGFSEEEETKYKNLTHRKRTLELRYKTICDLIKASRDIIGSSSNRKEQLVSSYRDLIKSDINVHQDSSFLSVSLGKLETLISKALAEFSEHINKRSKNLPDLLSRVESQLRVNEQSLAPLLSKVRDQKSMDSVNQTLAQENKKLETIKDIESKQESIKKQGNETNEELFETFSKIVIAYQNYANEVRKPEYQIQDEMKISSVINFDESIFGEFINAFDRRGNLQEFLSGLVDSSGNYSFNIETYAEIIKKISTKLNEKNRSPSVKKGVTDVDLSKRLFCDCFSINYIVRYKSDDIIKMSPGKRGLVLLNLILHLSNSTHPILIDQPEDNLDNRTIYTQLKGFVKERKNKRQIIMVTHNANLVVGSDSECVIVSNQSGQQSGGEKQEFRFEYVSGGLECTFSNGGSGGILESRGIREHVCEVLEGGVSAFRERELKYGLVY